MIDTATPDLEHDLTLDRFITYLERQPPRDIYGINDPDHCLVASWIKEDFPGKRFRLGFAQIFSLFNGRGDKIVFDRGHFGWRYGDALKRARRALWRDRCLAYIRGVFKKGA